MASTTVPGGSRQIRSVTVTDADVAAANKDGASGTYSMRTLGNGAAQACAGNDSRLSDSRNPTGSAGGDLTGTYANPTIAAGAVTLAKQASNARTLYNYLINGGFDFAQRQAPGALTLPTYNGANSTSKDGYTADRWKTSYQGANSSTLNYQRIDTNGSLETGLVARFYGRFRSVSGTGASKFMVYQILEGSQTFSLASRTVTFQCLMKVNATDTPVIRLGLVQLNSSGTIDTIPAYIVSSSSTWGANSTDPTLGTNLAYVTPSSVPTNAIGSVSGNAVTATLTTGWQNVAGTFTMPSNAKNIIVAIWTDSQFFQNDSLYLAQPGLYDGDSLRDWLPRFIGEEKSLVERYYEKSYDVDVAPGTVNSNGCMQDVALNSSNFYDLGGRVFRVSKRVIPSMGIYSINSGAIGKVYDTISAADVAVSANSIGTNAYGISSAAAMTAGHTGYWHHTAEADL